MAKATKYCTGYGVPHLKPAAGYLSCSSCRWNPNPVTVTRKPKALVIRYERGTVTLTEGEHYGDTHETLGKIVKVCNI
jgi:hypothetical protein